LLERKKGFSPGGKKILENFISGGPRINFPPKKIKFWWGGGKIVEKKKNNKILPK